MARPTRQERRHSNSSSSSTSPERGADDDNDSFMIQANDSQSSLALSLSEDMMTDTLDDESYEERCRYAPVYRLPAELLISIFSRLSSTKDLRACVLVSKDWARNSVGLLWHRPSMSNWQSVQNVVKTIRKADKMFAYQDLVKRLNMSTLGAQVSDGTLQGMIACKRIERLTLTTCTKVTDLSLAPLVDGNRSLVALDVTGIEGVTDKSLLVVAENCLRLQGLNVTGCRRLTDASMVALARNCRHLKRLKFNSCSQLTDTTIETVAANSEYLLEIDLYDLPLVESPAISALLTGCLHLRELRLMRCPRITDAAFTSISLDHDPFNSLRILDLTDCTEITDRAVERIVATCPRLRNLLLAKCRQLTDRAVYAITRLGKNLHYLHLGHCTRLTDESIKTLAKSCTRIRYIDLACCSNLTDHSVTQLATHLPKLKRVGLVKCAGITDRSIHALATHGGRVSSKEGSRGSINVLERVHLSYCTQLTLDGIHTLLNNCPRLTHLSLTGVQAFLRDDLTVFCREAPPEFNDTQRDVFCVFSGAGVSKLREHLNGMTDYLTLIDPDDDSRDGDGLPRMPTVRRHYHQQMPPVNNDNTDMIDEDLGDDTELNDAGDDGQDEPTVIQVPIISTPTANNTRPISVNQPQGYAHGIAHGLQPFDMPSFAGINPSQIPTMNQPPTYPFNPNIQTSQHAPRVSAGPSSAPSHIRPIHPSGGSAHQVTGMMGATMLEDNDEDVGPFDETRPSSSREG